MDKSQRKIILYKSTDTPKSKECNVERESKVVLKSHKKVERE